MTNHKKMQTEYHTIEYVYDAGVRISCKGMRPIILTDDEIDEIHGLKEANRRRTENEV